MRFSTLVPTLALITLGACNPVPDPQGAVPATTPGNTGVVDPTTANTALPRRPDPTQEYNRCLAGSVCPQVFPESCFCANRLRRDCAERSGLERVMVQDCASSAYFMQTRGRDGRFENLDRAPRPRRPSPRPRDRSRSRGRDGRGGRNGGGRPRREGVEDLTREDRDHHDDHHHHHDHHDDHHHDHHDHSDGRSRREGVEDVVRVDRDHLRDGRDVVREDRERDERRIEDISRDDRERDGRHGSNAGAVQSVRVVEHPGTAAVQVATSTTVREHDSHTRENSDSNRSRESNNINGAERELRTITRQEDIQLNTNINNDINSNRIGRQIVRTESDDRRPTTFTVVRQEELRRPEPVVVERPTVTETARPCNQHLYREPAAEIRLPIEEQTRPVAENHRRPTTRPIEAAQPVQPCFATNEQYTRPQTRPVEAIRQEDRERASEHEGITITYLHNQPTSHDSDRLTRPTVRYDTDRDQRNRYEAQRAQNARDSQLRRERDEQLRLERDQRDNASRRQRERDAELRRTNAARSSCDGNAALQKRSSPVLPQPSFSPSSEFAHEDGSKDPQGDVRYYRDTKPVLILVPGAEPLAAVEDTELWVARAEVTGRRGRYWQGNGQDGKGNLLAETPEGLVALNKFLFGEGISFRGAGGEGVSVVPAGEGTGRVVGKFDHIVQSGQECKCGGQCACNGECGDGCDCAGRGGYEKAQPALREPMPRSDQYRDSKPRP